jgi:hypothetical protein
VAPTVRQCDLFAPRGLERFALGSRWVVGSPYDGRSYGKRGKVVGYSRDRYGAAWVRLDVQGLGRVAMHDWVLFDPRSKHGRELRAGRTR